MTATELDEVTAGLLADQTYELVPIDSIRPHPLNPNEGDEAGIGESIDANRFYGAPTVRVLPGDGTTYEMLAGEHRWRQLRERGATHIPVIIQHDCDDRRALRILLVDNELARRGRYKRDILEQVLTELGDLDGTGFHLDQLASLEAEAVAASRTPGESEPELGGGDDDAPAKQFANEYGLVIICETEADQRALYDRFTGEGLKVKVVAI